MTSSYGYIYEPVEINLIVMDMLTTPSTISDPSVLDPTSMPLVNPKAYAFSNGNFIGLVSNNFANFCFERFYTLNSIRVWTY